MAIRFKKSGSRGRHFIAQWRRHRNLTQEQLAERLDISAATLSRIENRKIPYSQDFLEACADALNVDAGSLVMRDPEAPDMAWSIADRIAKLPELTRQQAIAVIDALERTGTRN